MSDLVQQMREKARGLLDAPFWNACADELAIARASQVGPIQVYIDQLKADRDRLAGERDEAKVLAMRLDRALVQCIAEKMTVEAELSAARAAVETVNRRATAIVQWLQVNQRDVFKRGLWDALNGADRATDSAGAEHG